MSERRAVYAHDFASVPSQFEDLIVGEDWARNTVFVKRETGYLQVSREFIQDAGSIDWMSMLPEPKWSERERWAIQEASVRLRLSRAWGRFRERIADRIDPERAWRD